METRHQFHISVFKQLLDSASLDVSEVQVFREREREHNEKHGEMKPT